MGTVRRPICPQGHDKRQVGVATNRQCRECRRTGQNTYPQNLVRYRRNLRQRMGRTQEQYDSLLAELRESSPDLAAIVERTP